MRKAIIDLHQFRLIVNTFISLSISIHPLKIQVPILAMLSFRCLIKFGCSYFKVMWNVLQFHQSKHSFHQSRLRVFYSPHLIHLIIFQERHLLPFLNSFRKDDLILQSNHSIISSYFRVILQVLLTFIQHFHQAPEIMKYLLCVFLFVLSLLSQLL